MEERNNRNSIVIQEPSIEDLNRRRIRKRDEGDYDYYYEDLYKKNKSIVVSRERTFLLQLELVSAETVDGSYPSGLSVYYAVAWVKPCSTIRTQPCLCQAGPPRWNVSCGVAVEPGWKYLYLELVQAGVVRDLGSSTHQSVVGRARLRLPKNASSSSTLSTVRRRMVVPLVKVGGRPGGQLGLEGDIRYETVWNMFIVATIEN